MTYKEELEFVDKHLVELGEHFDVVQILLSSCDGEGTSTIIRGIGNHWARVGMAHEFINADTRTDAADKIAEKMHEHDDDI